MKALEVETWMELMKAYVGAVRARMELIRGTSA